MKTVIIIHGNAAWCRLDNISIAWYPKMRKRYLRYAKAFSNTACAFHPNPATGRRAASCKQMPKRQTNRQRNWRLVRRSNPQWRFSSLSPYLGKGPVQPFACEWTFRLANGSFLGLFAGDAKKGTSPRGIRLRIASRADHSQANPRSAPNPVGLPIWPQMGVRGCFSL